MLQDTKKLNLLGKFQPNKRGYSYVKDVRSHSEDIETENKVGITEVFEKRA